MSGGGQMEIIAVGDKQLTRKQGGSFLHYLTDCEGELVGKKNSNVLCYAEETTFINDPCLR
jgi:hypothetical protein